MCIRDSVRGIPVVPVPAASAAVTALCVSGPVSYTHLRRTSTASAMRVTVLSGLTMLESGTS